MTSTSLTRTASEASFTSHDGAALHYRHWPASSESRRALVLFHRGHEHSERWQETVEELDLPDTHVFAWDARGHGTSPGERGSARDIGVLIADVEAFIGHLERQHGITREEMILIAHSVGAVVATAWVHDYAPPIRGLVLATPAFRVKLYVPFAVPLLRLKQTLFGPGYVKSYVKSRMLTHDPEQARLYSADERIFRQIAVNILLDLHDTGERLAADAGAIRVPTLLFSAGEDWVVDNSIQEEFVQRLGATDKALQLLPGFHHAIFHEKERRLVVDQIRTFVTRLFSASPQRPALLDADKSGYTKSEYDSLLPEPHTLSAFVRRTVFATIGRLSHGVDLGLRSGFDSGETLDYVYNNEPRGMTPLGRWFDQAYLESPGWSGIRIRRQNLEATLRSAIRELHAAGKKVHVLDAACGGGRYVLETLAGLRDIPATALLRDYRQQNLDVAEELRRKLQIESVKLVLGNAFDPSSFEGIEPRPNIGIISGLLELFPSNEPARNLLATFARLIEPGGVLIYTNQPWHPQLRFIAGVLRNREGQPWIMRRRTQEEMDELVQAAGFRKEAQLGDRWGIFTVSRAVRIAQ
jgi:alpha-beta hydrolase superfamily lysophospholipase/ubiquinone/menaquinone biosynthesis C-methylase UbiE